MLKKLREKLLARVRRISIEKSTAPAPLPDNPKELAKALFWPNDWKIKELHTSLDGDKE